MAKPFEISSFNKSDVKYAEFLLSTRPKGASHDLERPTYQENNDFGKIKISKKENIKRLIKSLKKDGQKS